MQAMKLDPRLAAAFLRFSGGFWKGTTAFHAWALTIGLALFLTLSTGITVALNRWQGCFFNALEKRDAEAALLSVPVFLAIIGAMAAIGVGIVYTRETLQVRWRAWIVDRLVGLWLGGNRFYHLGATHTEPDNPEYRISDDTRWATEPLTDLVIGLFSAVIAAAAFISILWSIGGSATIGIGSSAIVVPAYMVLLALAYGAIASGLMLWVGRRLVACVAQKNASEGEFRFSLMRMRENAESVALIGGASAEVAAMKSYYDIVVARWLAIVGQHVRLTWVTNASGPMIPIVPLLFAAPKYFAGQYTLGEVVQLAAAFVQVQLAISWIVDNYSRLSEWFASARRVMDIVEACDGIDRAFACLGESRVRLETTADGSIRLDGVAVTDVGGKVLVQADDLVMPAGARAQVHGNTSAGKSSLVRALAGLWPWGRGRIGIPAGARVMVVPQKPYLPRGTLRQALLYPDQAALVSEAAVQQALADTGLAHLAPRLDQMERWDQVLGNGERQRLCVARVLIQRPDVVVLDDALAALDEAAQDALEQTLVARLPRATLICLGQRTRADNAGIARFEIVRAGDTATVRALLPAMA